MTSIERNNLILQYEPLVSMCAGKHFRTHILPTGIEYGDLYSWGIEGLIDAIHKYDPTKSKFKTYAPIRISGQIKEGIRKWSKYRKGHKPKFVAALSYEVFSADHNDFVEVKDVMNGCSFRLFDLEYKCGAYSVQPDIQDYGRLNRCISQLPDKLRDVVTDYFFNGMTLSEIGLKNGYDNTRACQVKREAIERLRRMMR